MNPKTATTKQQSKKEKNPTLNNLKRIINSVSILFYRFMFPFLFFIHFPISNFKEFEWSFPLHHDK
jgi:hypothetical protein